MRDLGRVNRWFGGVAATQKMVERVAQVSGTKQLSLLEVAAGSGEVPELVRDRLARRGITLDVTLLDRARSHLLGRNYRIVGDALSLPCRDGAFDLVSCSLFAHHLNTQQLIQFVREALRVSRRAVLINDLVRHPVHLALVYASYPIMRCRVAWLDGVTSVRRAYVSEEIWRVLASGLPKANAQGGNSLKYFFCMGVIWWNAPEVPRC